uniref:Uncharacterized protein n=1 Tax=Anguilla anguilla TaxID=7936 RepID=A0A0E9XIX8_ANGAN
MKAGLPVRVQVVLQVSLTLCPSVTVSGYTITCRSANSKLNL